MNEKKQIIIIVGLLVVLIAVWVLVLQPSKKYKGKIGESEKESGLEFKVIVETAEKYFQHRDDMQKFSYEGDKDPFSLETRKIVNEVIGEEKKASEIFEGLVLKGILWDSQRPLAIINGEVVGTGSFIKGVVVKRIAPDHVVLTVEGKEKLLFIEGVKREK